MINAIKRFRDNWIPGYAYGGVNTDAPSLRAFLCRHFSWHSPYYKYGKVASKVTRHPNGCWSSSNGPEHLGYFCRCCEKNLGWEYPYRVKSWLPEWNRAR